MHIYAFGSISRGDIQANSDVDLLAIVDGFDSRFSSDTYSIYSYSRLRDLWQEGNPFAWHLSLESRLIFSSNNVDYLKSLGLPRKYNNCTLDCHKFSSLFRGAAESIAERQNSKVFDLSTVFLSIRNIATCYSLGKTNQPVFSRNSALCLGKSSLNITNEVYDILLRSRILCTRGSGPNITEREFQVAVSQFNTINEWMTLLTAQAEIDE
jgi:hypothetical protein